MRGFVQNTEALRAVLVCRNLDKKSEQTFAVMPTLDGKTNAPAMSLKWIVLVKFSVLDKKC